MREQIEALSARLGNDPLLVQGAGGNASWKSGDLLWLKASGMCMRDADARDIFVPVNLAGARDVTLPVAVAPAWADQIELRPSIETILHALMPHKVVVHLHSVALLSKLIMRDRESDLAALTDDHRYALIPYRKPGVTLAESVQAAINERPEVDVLLLANHGIVVAAETVDALTERLEELLRAAPAPERAAAAHREISLPPVGFHSVNNERIHDIAFDACAFNIARSAWAITPDHVVFLGPEGNTFDSTGDIGQLPLAPPFAIVRDAGVYLSDAEIRSASAIEEMLLCFRDVAMRVSEPEGVRTLSDSDVAELLEWEAEKYRQAISGVGSP